MKAKFVLNLLTVAAMCAAMAGCTEPNINTDTGKVQVRYTNNTGVDVFDVVANGKQIGTFRNGTTTNYILYDSFGADTGMPDISFNGIVNGDTVKSTSQFNWCGTEKFTITDGILDVSVELLECKGDNPSKYFSLRFTKINVPSPLINKTWKFTHSNATFPSCAQDYIMIFKENATVEFPLNCNISSGNYNVDENSFISVYGGISFSGFYPCTEKYCGELYELENFVVNYLSKAIIYSVQDNHLVIECKDFIYLYFEEI